jgi:hypothetical protein
MSSNKICAVGWFLLWVCLAVIDWNLAVAQSIAAPQATPTTLGISRHPIRSSRYEQVETPRPSKAKREYSFPLQSGGRSFDFHVQVDKTSTVTAVSIFRDGESAPFQSLPVWDPILSEQLTEYDENLELLKHADLNFDGFEDIELLIYGQQATWIRSSIASVDGIARQGDFALNPDLTDMAVNMEAYPESKALSSHEDWFGGPWQDSTNRWNDGKLELIEQRSLLGDWSLESEKECGFSYS